MQTELRRAEQQGKPPLTAANHQGLQFAIDRVCKKNRERIYKGGKRKENYSRQHTERSPTVKTQFLNLTDSTENNNTVAPGHHLLPYPSMSPTK